MGTTTQINANFLKLTFLVVRPTLIGETPLLPINLLLQLLQILTEFRLYGLGYKQNKQ